MAFEDSGCLTYHAITSYLELHILLEIFAMVVAHLLSHYGMPAHISLFGAVQSPSTALRAIQKQLVQEQATLRASEERFRKTFAHAGVGMGLVGLDGRWLQVNPALCRIIGYSETELQATTFQAITHPHDLDTDLAQQLLDGTIPSYEFEKRYIHRPDSGYHSPEAGRAGASGQP